VAGAAAVRAWAWSPRSPMRVARFTTSYGPRSSKAERAPLLTIMFFPRAARTSAEQPASARHCQRRHAHGTPYLWGERRMSVRRAGKCLADVSHIICNGGHAYAADVLRKGCHHALNAHCRT